MTNTSFSIEQFSLKGKLLSSPALLMELDLLLPNPTLKPALLLSLTISIKIWSIKGLKLIVKLASKPMDMSVT